MATVTGMTAAKMLEIQNSSIISGTIDGSDHLILTNYGGGTVDAGLMTTSDMSLAGNQTVTGIKTYNAGTLLDKGSMVFNVKAFGAVGDGTTDDTAAIQAAIDAAWAVGGGTVWFPKATYKLATQPIKFYTSAGTPIVAYSNIKLLGAGSILAQTTTGVDVIKCRNNAGVGAISVNNSIENLTLTFTGTATNSGHGVNLSQDAASGPVFKRWSMRNVYVTNCQGSGKYGFNLEGLEASTIERCKTFDCANGFFLNGGAQGNFTTGTNSTTLQNCFADMGANGVTAFRAVEVSYVSYKGCGVLYRATSAGSAYQVECGNAVSYDTCGFELDGTVTLAAGFKVTENSLAYGSGQVAIKTCYAYKSKTTKEVWVTNGCNAFVESFQSNSTVSGSVGLTLDGTARVTEVASTWPAGAPRTLSATAKWYTPGIPRVSSLASGAAPTPAAGIADSLIVYAAAVNMTVGAPTGQADDGQTLEIQFRDDGTARTIAHNAIFVNGPATKLTTTVLGKAVREVFQYSAGGNNWTCMSSVPAGW